MSDVEVDVVEDAAIKPTHAGMVCFNLAGQVLLVTALGASKEEWVFPKGHIEPEEDTPSTAEREVREEAGIRALCVNPSSMLAVTEYDLVTKLADGTEQLEHVVVAWYTGLAVERAHTFYEANRKVQWVAWQQALKLLEYDELKEVLKEALLFPRE